MRLHLSVLLVLPVGLLAACSSKQAEDAPPGNEVAAPPGIEAPPAPGVPSTPDAPDAPAAPDPLSRNPIEGIAAAKVVLDIGAPTDGAVWSAKEGALVFTTPLGQGALYRMHPDGTATKLRDGNAATGEIPIGNALDKAGNLITVEAKRIVRSSMAPNGGVPTPVVTGYSEADAGITAFDTLKNAVVSANGTMYATDPGYFAEPIANRIYSISPAGKVTVVEAFENLPRPNGIALTPDGKGLYVGFTQPELGVKPFVRRYIVNPDGTVGAPSKFVDLALDTLPDGIEVDQAGNVFIATKGGIAVFKADATKIGVVPVPEQPTGMAFGGKDLKTLYITTLGTKLFQLTVNVPGVVQ